MDSTRSHRVRFLLPDKDDWSDGKWLDEDEMRKRFDLKLSRLVVPPPPKMAHQLKDPDELLVELKKKLLAIDRTIKFREVILEEEEDQDLQPQTPALTSPESPSEVLNEDSNERDNQQLPAQQDQPTTQQQQQKQQQQQQQQQPQQQEKPPTNRPQTSEQAQANHSPMLTSKVGPKRPPLPPNKRPKEEPRGAQTSSGTQTGIKRQDSLPRSFKTRRRSFRDFSKRQFQRALSAMNLSKSANQDQKLLRSNSFDAKIDGSSLTDSTTGLQQDGPRIRSKSSSSLLLSNLRLRFHRFPSNIYKKSKKGDSTGQSNMKRRSSWSKLFSSWSSNLQTCTRVQTDD